MGGRVGHTAESILEVLAGFNTRAEHDGGNLGGITHEEGGALNGLIDIAHNLVDVFALVAQTLKGLFCLVSRSKAVKPITKGFTRADTSSGGGGYSTSFHRLLQTTGDFATHLLAPRARRVDHSLINLLAYLGKISHFRHDTDPAGTNIEVCTHA